MTTMAALLGGVPMMLGTGVGSEIRQPLGYAIVGGLALSQILTLYTTPVVYIYLDRLQTWLFGKLAGRRLARQRQPDAGRMTAIRAGSLDTHAGLPSASAGSCSSRSASFGMPSIGHSSVPTVGRVIASTISRVPSGSAIHFA